MEEYKAVQADMQHKKKKNGLIAAIIILIILAIAAIGGTWYYMNNKAKNAKKTQDEQIQQLQKQINDLKLQSATSQSIKTTSYTTKYQLLKFAYENGWTIKDTSAVAANGNSFDSIVLTSPNNFSISLSAGNLQRGGSCGDCKVLYSEPVTVLGKQLYINYVQDSGNGVSRLIVSEKMDDAFGYNLTSLKASGGNTAQLSVTAGYRDGDSYTVKDLNEIKSDGNVQSLKSFLQSLSY
jgi:hypothetical protein